MIEHDEEKYITATEVARRLKIAYGTCASNVLPMLATCYLPGRKHALYRLSEVEELSQVRIVEKRAQPLTLVPQEHDVVCIEGTLCKEIL